MAGTRTMNFRRSALALATAAVFALPLGVNDIVLLD